VVDIPTSEDSQRVLRTSQLIQQRMLAKVQVKRARQDADCIFKSMGVWRGAQPFVLMRRFYTKVLTVQRFLRWSRRRLATVQEQTEAHWERLERDLVTAQVKQKTGVSDSVILMARQATKRRSAKAGPLSPSSKSAVYEAERFDQQVRAQMMPEKRRQAVVRAELRRRRREILPKLAVWRLNLETYEGEVRDWRMTREACKAMGVTMDANEPVPVMPGVPSHIPTATELVALMKTTRENGYSAVDQRPVGSVLKAAVKMRLARRESNLDGGSPTAAEDAEEYVPEPWEEALIDPPGMADSPSAQVWQTMGIV